MPLNAELLDAAVEFARKSSQKGLTPVKGAPAVWRQSYWAEPINPDSSECGTAYCIAGYIVAQDPNYREEWAQSNTGDWYIEPTLNGEDFSYLEAAPRTLGLTREEVWDGYDRTPLGDALSQLWVASNKLEDVERIAARIKELAS